MQSLTLILTILATLALAAPTPKSNLSKRSFAVPRIRNPAYVRSPSKALNKVYRKYGWDITFGTPTASSTSSPDATWGGLGSLFSELAGAAGDGSSLPSSTPSTATSASSASGGNEDASTATSVASSSATGSSSSGGEVGSTSATLSANEAEYYSPVDIGGQTLNLDFDTGSADLWVFSSELPSYEIGSHTAFDPSKSANFKTLEGYSFDISYGDGSGADGIVGTGTVSIGDATVTNQAIELATSVSSEFTSDTASDGLVGLAFSVLNAVSPTPQKTFFANVMNDLAQPVFTANLGAESGGGYEFGAIDKSKYSGDLTYVDIDNSEGFWQFTSTSYTIGGKAGTNSVGNPAIIDTGTSLLLLDENVIEAYWSQVEGAENSEEGYTYPCSTTPPDFAVAVGDSYMVKIPGSAMSYSQDGESCFGGLQSNSGNNIQIFGDFALKHMFVVFDGGNNQIGVADKA